MVLWDYQQPRILSVNAYPDAEFLRSFMRFAQKSVPAFQAIYWMFFEFDFYMASPRRGQLRYGLLLSPTPFLPTFYVCIAFSGYRLILGILSPGFQCWLTHRVFHHSRPLGHESSPPSFCIPYQEIHDFCFSLLSSMTVWGLLMGLEGSLQTIVHFHFEHFLNTIYSSRGLG